MVVKLFKNITKLDIRERGPDLKTIKKYPEYPLYLLSCITYLLVGLKKIRDREKIFGILLMIQTYVTFKSDVMTIGKHSIWHLIDRYYATLLSILYFVMNSENYIKKATIFVAGSHLLRNSQIFYYKSKFYPSDYNISRFMMWHTIWHMFVPFMIL